MPKQALQYLDDKFKVFTSTATKFTLQLDYPKLLTVSILQDIRYYWLPHRKYRVNLLHRVHRFCA